MSVDIKFLLKDNVLKTFFELTMMEAVPVSDNEISHESVFESFSINNRYPELFRLEFCFPLTTKRFIVEAIYSQSYEELSELQIEDCLLEVVNVIAGNYFTAYFGQVNPFELGLPCPLPEQTKAKALSFHNFALDEGLFTVKLFKGNKI